MPKEKNFYKQQGYTIGSPSFVTPETYSRHEYSKVTDVYSFGMIIYCLFTNEIPFSDKQPMEIDNEVLAGNRSPFKVPIPTPYKERKSSIDDPPKRAKYIYI